MKHDFDPTKLTCRRCGVLAKHDGTKLVAMKCSTCGADAVIFSRGEVRCSDHAFTDEA